MVKIYNIQIQGENRTKYKTIAKIGNAQVGYYGQKIRVHELIRGFLAPVPKDKLCHQYEKSNSHNCISLLINYDWLY